MCVTFRSIALLISSFIFILFQFFQFQPYLLIIIPTSTKYTKCYLISILSKVIEYEKTLAAHLVVLAPEHSCISGPVRSAPINSWIAQGKNESRTMKIFNQKICLENISVFDQMSGKNWLFEANISGKNWVFWTKVWNFQKLLPVATLNRSHNCVTKNYYSGDTRCLLIFSVSCKLCKMPGISLHAIGTCFYYLIWKGDMQFLQDRYTSFVTWDNKDAAF